MKTYTVTITETLKMDVEVEARSAEEAREIAKREWKNRRRKLLAVNHTA